MEKILNKEKEEEYYLRNINAKEWSIVDNPAIGEGWLILKRADSIKNAESSDDPAYLYCNKCEIKVAQEEPREKGTQCPQCGEEMGVEVTKEKEMKEAMADKNKEKDKEDVEKVSVKDAAKKAAEILEQATGGSDKEKKRLVLLIANLKSLAGVKKSAEEDELVEKFDTFEEYAEDVEKAGRKVSKETAASISEIANSLRKAVEALESLVKDGPKGKGKKDYGYPKYGYPKYGYPKVKKNIDNELDEILGYYKDGLIEDNEVRGLLSLLGESEEEIEEVAE